MSFFSMLQMARGQEPPHQQKLSQSANTAGNKESSARSAPGPKPAQPESSTAPPVKRPHISPSLVGKPRAPTEQLPRSAAVSSRSPQKTNNSSQPTSAQTNPPIGSSMKTARSFPSTTNALPSSAQKLSASTKSSSAASTTTRASPSPSNSTRKKLSFKDVMNQAAKVNTSKLEVNLRTTDSRKQAASGATAVPRKPRLKPRELPAKEDREDSRSSRRSSLASATTRTRGSEPAPVAQPLPEVLEKRQRQLESRAGKSRKRPDEEDDLGDFVASDEEVEEEAPHEEIWKLFNRGPKKRYVDYDSDDDMEARGDEILNEERRSALQARREDAEEERKLAELAQRKQKSARKPRT